MYSLNGTYISTGTAVGANIRINLVDIALGNCFNRALVYTCSACGTIIVNFVSHFDKIWLIRTVNKSIYFFRFKGIIQYKIGTDYI